MCLSVQIFLLLMIGTARAYGDDFGTDHCPYLSLMTASEDSIIYANVETSKFYITRQEQHNGSECIIPFNESAICGIAMGKKQSVVKQWFIYWAYDEDIEGYYVSKVSYSELTPHKCQYNYSNRHYLHIDFVVFKVTDDGLLAYGFDYNFAYIYDLQSNQKNEIQPSTGNLHFIPCDISLTKTNEQAVVVGYLKDGILSNALMYATVCLWQFNRINHSMLIINCTKLSREGYHYSDYQPGPKLSVDIDYNNSLVAIGNSPEKNIKIFRIDHYGMSYIHTFQNDVQTNSICWLTDGHRIAVVAHLTPTSPWSQSQIQIYDYNTIDHNWPDYIFPNNQQQLDTWNYKNPVFILILAWFRWNSLIILMDTRKVLVILSAEAGSYPDPLAYSWFDNPWVWIGLRNRRHHEQSATPCWPGMYKDEHSLTPCKICPSQMKSLTNSTECSPCNQSSFCPLASPDEIDISQMIDIIGITTYPRSPDSTQFEDILLTHIFLIGSTQHCILISPLFWTLMVIAIVFLVLVFIGIMKFFPRSHRHRTIIKKIFRQADLIGEGEFWIGGLMSFSLLVLVIFAFLFSNEYVTLYPIEHANQPKLACDHDLRNAKFDTSLKLLTATRSTDDQIIFDLLDNQPFTLIVNFVNTNFDCSLLNILEGTGQNLHEPISPMECVRLNSSQVIHTSIPTYHEVTFRYTIRHFAPIGGLYVCLKGSANNSGDDMNILYEMNFCKWISKDNQTIGFTPEITLLNTKIINRTANLTQGQPTKSSGVWQTTFIGSELSDQLLYDRKGEYHRYLSTETILTISLNENHFYVENNQEPIARKSEANFHTFLFVTLALEMFCLTFIIFKLIIAPIFRLVEQRILLCFRVTPLIEQETNVVPPETTSVPLPSPVQDTINLSPTCEHLSPEKFSWE